MPKARSEELRMLVVSGVEEKGLTIAAAADLFQVGTASVKRWLAQYRRTSDVRPKAVGGVRMIWIGADEKDRLIELLKTMSDATVQELADAYNERYEAGASRSAVARALIRFGITRKKSPPAPQRPKHLVSPKQEPRSRPSSP